MILDRIRQPLDLNNLARDEQVQLACEIREFLVDTLTETGGHLGSNLGVVELTMALHMIFQVSNDKIIWDTGHQTYVHKILTGRLASFSTLRKRGGLSGFPCRAESPHDWVENSHASMALSYAQGLSLASSDTFCRVIAVVGDGALTGGPAYEAISNIGFHRTPVIIVLNDNGRSYAATVSSLSSRDMSGGETGRTGAFFQSLGVSYLGPIDGHDIEALRSAFAEARNKYEPIAVHVITRKGEGCFAAESDNVMKLHQIAGRSSGFPGHGHVSLPSFTDVFSAAVVEAGSRDGRVHAVTAAMASVLGLLPFASTYPDRFHDVGIAEQHALGLCAGLAMGGGRPIFVVTSAFLARATDQLHMDIGLHRLPVVICVDRSGINGSDGPSGQGVLDLPLLSSVPNMIVFSPSSASELRAMLDYALSCNQPCAIRYPKGPAPIGGPPGHGLNGIKRRNGSDICIIAVGRLVDAAVQAAELVERSVDVSVTVWDPRIVWPLDEVIVREASQYSLVITVDDGYLHGGLFSLVAMELSRSIDAPAIVGLGVPTQYLPQGDNHEILRELGLDPIGIAKSITQLIAARPRGSRRGSKAGVK